MDTGDCPTEAELTAFQQGDLPLDESERLALHLEACPDCEVKLRLMDQATRDSLEARLRRIRSNPTEDLQLPSGTTQARDRAPTPGSAGTVVGGRYKLVERIGEGGMGDVWMAQQTEPVRRLVALKLIKEGMDTRQVLARFDAERQALALMDHPNIARVFDAGASATGRPFFVMDLVKGTPITTYCDDHNLTTRERLELFVPVCRAIQHAHQKGILHRDVKPSNVLVARYDGKPVPKFGFRTFSRP